MSTFLDYLAGNAKMKPGKQVTDMAKQFREHVLWEECFVIDRYDGIASIDGSGETTREWENNLEDILSEFCISWAVDGQEKCCEPWRFYKTENGKPERVIGTNLVYFTGFEDEFIKQLPDEVIEKMKASR